jgi:23S rRNA pseudouridine2605 synthase
MPEPIRLQKFLADAGVCSRREAEALISQGRVSVNQQTAQIGMKVTPGVDRVVVDSKVIQSTRQEHVTLLLNKPKGYSCERHPPSKLKSVFELVPHALRSPDLRVAGELDTESEGLLILTTDGDLYNKLVHPSGGVQKVYRTILEEPVPLTKIDRIRKGFHHEGGRLKAEKVTVLSRRQDGLANQIELVTYHGRKREVRQLFDFLRVDLRRLRRVQIGLLVLKRIPLRLCRPLSILELSLVATPATTTPPKKARTTKKR